MKAPVGEILRSAQNDTKPAAGGSERSEASEHPSPAGPRPARKKPAKTGSALSLNAILEEEEQEKKKELVKDIEDKYNAAFDELEKYAESAKVERNKFAMRDTTITQKTNTNNFYALQANANSVPQFYEEQMKKIDDAKPGDPSGRKRKVVHLSTHTTQPMRTEADIDLYLQSLKVQLMKHLDENTDLVVG
jgi:hypothetical protein